MLVVLLAAQPCIDEATIKTIRGLAQQAVEQAFVSYVDHLYSTWMRDETPDQTERIQRGMARAIRAYLSSRRAIDAWVPLRCR